MPIDIYSLLSIEVLHKGNYGKIPYIVYCVPKVCIFFK